YTHIFLVNCPPPPCYTLFPYTTLFRSSASIGELISLHPANRTTKTRSEEIGKILFSNYFPLNNNKSFFYLNKHCFLSKCDKLFYILDVFICIVGFLAILIISISDFILCCISLKASLICRLILFRVTALPIFLPTETPKRKWC